MRAGSAVQRAWAAEDFKIVDNANGTRTYFIAVDDIHRGIDVKSWTGEPNPMAHAGTGGCTRHRETDPIVTGREWSPARSALSGHRLATNARMVRTHH